MFDAIIAEILSIYTARFIFDVHLCIYVSVGSCYAYL